MANYLKQHPLVSRRRFLALTGGVVGAAYLASCAPAPLAPPQHGGRLRIAISDSLTTFDPHAPVSTMDTWIGYLLYDNLIRRNQEGAANPLGSHLAEAWEIADDAKKYTFYLRQDVVFQHGTPFTARDVVYSIERMLDPTVDAVGGPALAAVASVEAVDEYTVNINLDTPSVVLPFALGNVGIQMIPHDRTTEQLVTEPSGSGPFRLVENLSGDRLILERNPDYWDGELPYVDDVELLVIPEEDAQINALLGGTIDIIPQVSQDGLNKLEGAPEVQLVEGQQGIYPTFVMDVTHPPFDDVRVRQALKHAINREQLHQTILQGRGTIHNDQPVAPISPFWVDTPPLAYDVDRARTLLAEAGYPDGFEVTLSVAEILPRIVETARLIQAMAAEAGITIVLEELPVETFWSQRYQQAPFFVSWWRTLREPYPQLSLVYITEGSYNESNWSNPTVDALIASASGEIDNAVRQTQYAEVQRIISRDGGVIIPYIAPVIVAARSHVQGIIPDSVIYPQYIWLNER